ncbi:MAG: thioredoxin domain-containing protein [Anaerolineales bacterium]|nr:thioredoxin domain-containing protein [Anaerolineales bacterium]
MRIWLLRMSLVMMLLGCQETPTTPTTIPITPSPEGNASAVVAAMNVMQQLAIGPETAIVTIVEYGTYGCQVCRRVYQLGLIDKLTVRYPRDIRYIYIPWPVIHPNDVLATEAVFCAQEQGYDQFWLLHRALLSLDFMDYDHYTTDEAYFELAANLGLDADGLRACLDAGVYHQMVHELVDEGYRLRLPGTPAFFVNGLPSSAFTLEGDVLQRLFEKRPN